MLKDVTMNDEILNNNEEQPDEKELLRQRREEQIERVKAQYETDVKEKAEAKVRMEKELEKELAPFITVRKGLIALCGLMWFFAAFCLLTGTLEMKIFLPMCMFALAALAGVNVPIFVKKKKIFDGIIAGICTVICFVTGVIILMFG